MLFVEFFYFYTFGLLNTLYLFIFWSFKLKQRLNNGFFKVSLKDYFVFLHNDILNLCVDYKFTFLLYKKIYTF